jgi:formylglycine-generating enzyme required for sulfatase activity
MKRLFKIIIGIFIVGCLTSATSLRPFMYTVTVKINDTLNIDEREVDVQAWLSYYTWLQENEVDLVSRRAMPDSNAIDPIVWQLIKNKSSRMNKEVSLFTYQYIGNYDADTYESIVKIQKNKPLPSFNQIMMYPMTGLSYEQVMDFCEWRTEVVGEKKVEYRLPTETEWTMVAKLGLKSTEKSQGFCDSLDGKKPSFNYKTLNSSRYKYKESIPICNLQSAANFLPNELKIWDLFGNVSEMTSKKGIAKGGSFNSFAKQCNVDSVQHYKRAEKWLGFRCVAILLPQE